MIDCQSDPVEEGLLLRESHRRISAAEQVSRGANAARGRADGIERSCAQGGAAVNPFRAVLPWRSVQRLTPVAETQSQVLVQIRFGVDFAHGAVNVVGDPPKLDGLFVIHDITTARVTVTRLSHAADVDHPTLVAVGYAVPGIGINRPNEAKILGKNAWHMRVTLKADSRHHGKQLFHFLDVLRVFGKHILISWATGRTVYEQRCALIDHARQVADVLHSRSACFRTIMPALYLGTRPENCLLGGYIESLRVK